MKKAIGIVATTMIMGLSAAQAQGLYGEIAYQSLDFDTKTNPAAVRLIGGYEITPHIAVEGMLGLSAKKGKETVDGIPVSLKVKELWGVYAKPKFKVGESLELFARLGYAGAKAKATATAFGYSASATVKDDDFSYGVGMSYAITPQMSITADYLKISDVDGFAIGLGWRF